MIRRPPRSTLDRSAAASDVYKRQGENLVRALHVESTAGQAEVRTHRTLLHRAFCRHGAVSYTHLRAHETVLDLVCRLLLEKKKNMKKKNNKQKKTNQQNLPKQQPST